MKAKIKIGVTIFLLFFVIGMTSQSYAEVNDNKSRKTKCKSGGGTVSDVNANTFICTLSGDRGTASVTCTEGKRCTDRTDVVSSKNVARCMSTCMKTYTWRHCVWMCTGEPPLVTQPVVTIKKSQPLKGVQTPSGSSNLIEKRQPPKGSSTIIGPKETKKQGNMVMVPRLLEMSRGKVEKTLKKLGLRPEFTGRGTVVKDQRPKPRVLLLKGSKVKVNLWTPPPTKTRPVTVGPKVVQPGTPATRTGPVTVRPKVVQPGSGSSGVKVSSITVNCTGGNSFVITTGTESGACRTQKDADGNVIGGNCGDKSGNGANVDCTSNGGAGACDRSQGSGGCTSK